MVDQGYEFNVIPDYASMISPEVHSTLNYYHAREQQELLLLVQKQDESVGLDEVIATNPDDLIIEKGAKVTSKKEEKKKHTLFKSWVRGR